ncbi:MAG: FAD-dependent monooxygenase [Burkholderiaceae bacterium]
MKVCVIGGGPGGLFAARLLKRSRPDAEVQVHEQNAPDATFGFGVGISMAARDRMREYDPEVYDALAQRSLFNNRQEITLNGEALLLEYPDGGGAIRRLDLLAALSEQCRAVGVQLVHGSRIDDIDAIAREFDVVIGADGANSAVRARFADEFDVQTIEHGNRFAWFGAHRALTPSGLEFIDTPDGPFVGHYYAYGESLSTFVPECDEATWEASGLAAMNDAERKRFIERLFAKRLGGAPLVENKSIWRTFRAAHANRWQHRNIVLIGDALRIAHYSLGSGTRLAMEDAMALHDALIAHEDDMPAALTAFEAARRPVRDTFGAAAERSIAWYEDMRVRMRAPLVRFVHDFLTRTGRVSDERLASYAPGFHRVWLDYLAAQPSGAAQTEAHPAS